MLTQLTHSFRTRGPRGVGVDKCHKWCHKVAAEVETEGGLASSYASSDSCSAYAQWRFAVRIPVRTPHIKGRCPRSYATDTCEDHNPRNAGTP